MTAQPDKPRSGRGLRVAFGVSLAINLLVIGAIAGAAFSDRGGNKGPRGERDGRRPGPEMSAIGLYGRALSKSDRKALGQSLRSRGGHEGRELRQDLRALGLEAVAVLKAEPFVPQSFTDILNRQQDLIKSRSDEGRAALVTHVANMSEADRLSYAVSLEEALERGPRRRKKK